MSRMKSRGKSLSDSEKVKWFSDRIKERMSLDPVSTPRQIESLVRDVRKAFKAVHGRDVPGSFVSRLLGDLGLGRKYSESTLLKRKFMFEQMNRNANYRHNKTQLKKLVENHFKEEILDMVFDELFEEWHSIKEHPAPEVDIDIYGQKSLFGFSGE